MGRRSATRRRPRRRIGPCRPALPLAGLVAFLGKTAATILTAVEEIELAAVLACLWQGQRETLRAVLLRRAGRPPVTSSAKPADRRVVEHRALRSPRVVVACSLAHRCGGSRRRGSSRRCAAHWRTRRWRFALGMRAPCEHAETGKPPRHTHLPFIRCTSSELPSPEQGRSGRRLVPHPNAWAGPELRRAIAGIGQLALLEGEAAASDTSGETDLQTLELGDSLVDPRSPRAR